MTAKPDHEYLGYGLRSRVDCGALVRRVRLATVIRELMNGLAAADRRHQHRA
jgi:hypothetical protein